MAPPPQETEQDHDRRIARALRQHLHAVISQEGGMPSDAVMASCSEFWVQVVVDAHVAERRQGYLTPWEEVVERLESISALMREEVMQRLQRAWTPETRQEEG